MFFSDMPRSLSTCWVVQVVTKCYKPIIVMSMLLKNHCFWLIFISLFYLNFTSSIANFWSKQCSCTPITVQVVLPGCLENFLQNLMILTCSQSQSSHLSQSQRCTTEEKETLLLNILLLLFLFFSILLSIKSDITWTTNDDSVQMTIMSQSICMISGTALPEQ